MQGSMHWHLSFAADGGVPIVNRVPCRRESGALAWVAATSNEEGSVHGCVAVLAVGFDYHKSINSLTVPELTPDALDPT